MESLPGICYSKPGLNNNNKKLRSPTEQNQATRKLLMSLPRAKQEGIHAKLVSLDQYRLTDLAKRGIFSNGYQHPGEGEPPNRLKSFMTTFIRMVLNFPN
jgi:hypothetical protein